MNYKLRKSNGIDIFDLEGQVKGTDSKEFTEVVDGLLSKGVKQIGINFARTAFIDSGCIGSLVMADKKAKERGIRIGLANLSEDIKDLFEMTQVNTIIPSFASESEMLKGLKEGS